MKAGAMLRLTLALLPLALPAGARAEVEGVVVVEAQSPQRADAEALRKKLQSRVDLEADGEPLRQLLERLARRHDIAIRFDDAAIRKRGISLDAAVTIQVGNFTLQAALGRVLDLYGLQLTVDEKGLLIAPARLQPKAAPVDPAELRRAPVRVLQPAAVIRQNRAQLVFEVEVVQPPPVVRDADADDDVVEEFPAIPQQHRIRVSLSSIDRWLFGSSGRAEDMRANLTMQLRRRIEVVDALCGLTDIQKQKLDLAGRGDIRRFFDQVDEARNQLKQVQHDPPKALELLNELNPLQRAASGGLFGEGSLFAKTLKSNLTPEQAEKWEKGKDGPPPWPGRSGQRQNNWKAPLERMLDRPLVPARER